MTATDIHTHLVPALAADILAAAGLRDAGGGRVADGEQLIGPPDLYEPAKLLAWLSQAGLSRALVSIPPPMYRQDLRADQAQRWVRSLNDALAEAVEGHDVLVPLAYLPFEHPELAMAELDRLESWAGFTAAAGGRSVSLAEPRLDGVWQRLVTRDAPLVLHPGTSPDTRLQDLYLSNLLGNPAETGLAAAQLLLGGVLERHPELRIALVHCGGVLPAVLGRYQRGVDSRRPGVGRQGSDLRAEARRLWVDCLAHDPAIVDVAAEMVGEDHLLIGSDWPFPMGTEDPRALLAHRGSDVVARAGGENAERFLSSGAPDRRRDRGASEAVKSR